MLNNSLTLLEVSVLKKLLQGDFPQLVQLQQQIVGCTVTARELTGVGFYTSFFVPDIIHGEDGFDIIFGDVIAEIKGLEHGAGFLLYVKNGVLDTLEGYSYDESWPESADEFTLRHMNGEERDWMELQKSLQTRKGHH